MNSSQITMDQIASLAGVNISTVSRVFNPNCGHPTSKKISEKVLAIAAEHDYVPKSSARSLAHGRSFTIGVILHTLTKDLASPAFSLLLSEFTREALRLGYQTVLMPVHDGNFDEQVVRQIRSENADAYFIGSHLAGSKTMQELAKRNLPAVTYMSDKIIDFQLPNLTLFSLDNSKAYEQLFKTVKMRGFNEFAFLEMEHHEKSSRFHEIKRAELHGLSISENIFCSGNNSPYALRATTLSNALALMPRIKQHELIICQCDFMALGLCDALRISGLVPGKDISVIGYDNIEANTAAKVETPFLTTIGKNEKKTGCQMVQTLLDKLNNRVVSNSIKISADFILRQSLGAI
jgi:LacI family transcriptional regulator, galactose operon repressor